MLNPDDRSAIEGLFSRLAEAERRAPDRDADAETLINRELVRQPAAPYYLAQTVLVQQHALEQAELRIRELEDEAAQGNRGGFLGGLFDDGRGRQNRPSPSPSAQPMQRNRGPWDRDEVGYGRGQGGSGFLAGAAQTALGVAGGVLIGNAIGSMFGSGAAHAAEADNSQTGNDQTENSQDNQQDSQQDSGNAGGDDGGFGGDDGGGFDMGGDF